MSESPPKPRPSLGRRPVAGRSSRTLVGVLLSLSIMFTVLAVVILFWGHSVVERELRTDMGWAVTGSLYMDSSAAPGFVGAVLGIIGGILARRKWWFGLVAILPNVIYWVTWTYFLQN